MSNPFERPIMPIVDKSKTTEPVPLIPDNPELSEAWARLQKSRKPDVEAESAKATAERKARERAQQGWNPEDTGRIPRGSEPVSESKPDEQEYWWQKEK